MRILAVTHQYPTPGQPTFAPYNRQQFARLARLHDLRIIRPVPWPIAVREALRTRSSSDRHVSVDGIEVRTPVFRFPPRILGHRYGAYFERSVAVCAADLLEQFQPDVLLSSWAHPDGWAAVRLGRRVGLPVVIKVLGSDVLVLATGRRGERVAEALGGADAVVAVSEDLAKHVVRLGVPADRVHVVPEGIDLEQFAPGDARLARERLGLPAAGALILFVGNVLHSKGAADLVRACAVLRDRGVTYQCRLVGHGRDSGAVAQLVRAQRLGDRVRLTGVRPQAELAEWYRACDVVALPSHSEGVPNVLREALACGKPFVATHVGGIPEIADSDFSRLVAPGAIDELADALAATIAAPPAVDAERVRRSSVTWEESARLLADRLEAVVDARRRAPAIDPVDGAVTAIA
jgi:glycosyltransferase involved in cell wall biosynthesis